MIVLKVPSYCDHAVLLCILAFVLLQLCMDSKTCWYRLTNRFHQLPEFDNAKRSCRRRLAGHNERRRKPQPDPLAMQSRLQASLQGSIPCVVLILLTCKCVDFFHPHSRR